MDVAAEQPNQVERDTVMFANYISEPNAEEPIIRSVDCLDGLQSQFDPKIKTLWDNFGVSAAKYRDNTFLCWREIQADGTRGQYIKMTYAQAGEQVACLASYFNAVIGIEKLGRVAMWSLNRPKWDITEHACNSQSIVTVPLYATLGPNATEYVLNHSECTVCVVSVQNLPRLIAVLDKTPVNHIICMDAVTDEMRASVAAAKDSCKLVSWDEAQDTGKNNLVKPRPPDANDMASLIYTSGTTGDPKGVIHTHESLIAALTGVLDLPLNSSDRYFSYLPTAHIYARVVHAATALKGASIWFFQGDPLKLFEDCVLVKPTWFAGVPRVYGKLHLKINAAMKTKGPETWAIYQQALATKLKLIKSGQFESPFDSKLFVPIRKQVGLDECRFLLSGAAPLDAEVHDWLQCVFGPTLQGYGLTETGAALTIQPYGPAYLPPKVAGRPLVCCDVKLVSIPDMNYSATADPPCGEICVRGKHIFQGYYKSPDLTAAVLTSDGWFHTGDVGRFNKDLSLSVIDRKKNIFKLAQGEYVAPDYIEGVYGRSPLIQQIFVHGDSWKNSLVAVVVPFPPVLQGVAKSKGIDVAGDVAALLAHPFTKQAIFANMTELGEQAKLRGYEKVQAIHIDPTPFSVENHLITPTFKSIRGNLRKHYTEVIAELYSEMEQ